jgi:DNA-binding CsgD family transcriptional regulator
MTAEALHLLPGMHAQIEEVRTAFDARSALLMTPDERSRMMVGPPGLTPENREKLIAMPLNPWRDRLIELRLPRPTGGCRIGSSYLPPQDLRRSGYFEITDKDIQAGPLVTLHVEGDDLPPLNPRTSLVLTRAPGERDFTDDTVRTLKALHAPLRSAVRNYWAFERIRRLEGAAETAYDALPQPVLVLRADGGIEHANPAADALLVGGELLGTADGRLMRVGSHAGGSVQRLLSAALRGVAQQVGICSGGDAGSTTGVLHLTRMPSDSAFEARWPLGSVLATVQLRPAGSDARFPALARRFGLTGAEADVLRELSRGANAKQIAQRRQVRLSTVRTQIRGLLEKTRSRRQADVVRLLLE